ncbi:MAG TPA: anaerobic ribonucleoside-triphosphate reductase [Dissulfurispiraceae bacterium]|nr:anaerobic ribonucleoside-triphosphate reductase [Dissulfurispiraceae bacterium]
MNPKVQKLIDEFGLREQAAVEIVAMTENSLRAKVRRIPCEVWSRVVGYMRPTSQWNPGKREEFVERREYKVNGGRYEPEERG